MAPQAVLGRQQRAWPGLAVEIFEFISWLDHGCPQYPASACLGRRPVAYHGHVKRPADGDDWLELTGEVLEPGEALAFVERDGCGAKVGFAGTVRDRAEGRDGVFAIDYEAYETHVVARFAALVAQARDRWPMLGGIAVWHRVGRVGLKESSVVIAVSSPHRSEAFDACRFLIDEVKATAPIWKREHWAGGARWSPAARPIREVCDESPPARGNLGANR